jgi:hypothetical protein
MASLGRELRLLDEDGSFGACGDSRVWDVCRQRHELSLKSSRGPAGSCFFNCSSTAFADFVAGLFAVYSLMVLLIDVLELSGWFWLRNEEPNELDFDTQEAAEIPGLKVACDDKRD